MEKQARAAKRAEARQRKEMEKQRKAAEKAALERHKANRQSFVDQRNQELKVQLNKLESILETNLSEKITLQQIVSYQTSSVFIPVVPDKKPVPPHKSIFTSSIPEPTLIERFFGTGKKKRQILETQAEAQYSKALKQFEIQKFNYEGQRAVQQAAINKRKQITEDFVEKLKAKHGRTVEQYFHTVLDLAKYPPFFPDRNIKLAYNPDTEELVVEYDLPHFDVIMPKVKGYKYVKTRDEISELSFNRTDERKLQSLYEDVIAAITLRSLNLLFNSDHIQALNLVVFNGMINTVDKATGQDIRPCLVSVQVSKEDFMKLDLARVEKSACLKYLKAQTSPSSHELVPVKPLVQLITADDRFINEIDILTGLDSRMNLLELSPGEFEHLISNLFGQMGFKTGTTRISRDGGVDVIAFDERPILGGKVIIQAK